MTKSIRHKVFSVEVDLLTVPKLFALIEQSITTKTLCVIANHNLHSIYLYHHDAGMHNFYQHAHYCFIDGMLIVFWMKLLGIPAHRVNRFTSVDWIDPLMQLACKSGWRVSYVGSQPQVAEQGAERLRTKYPGLVITTQHGYFDTQRHGRENQQVVEQINGARPNILLVGMGMPKQEQWILNNIADLPADCIIPVGACFDYVAGSKPIPPRWMSRLGFEWLGRLITEPRRLWWRYLIEPWFLLQFALRDLRRYCLSRNAH